MKKIILIGRTGSGKTTLTQALLGKTVKYDKTQYIKIDENCVDTPGEYAETKLFGGALAIYSYDSDVVALVQDPFEPYSLFPPCIATTANRPVIGIVTKCDIADARLDLAKLWLSNAGCDKIFEIDSKTGSGIKKLSDFLHKK